MERTKGHLKNETFNQNSLIQVVEGIEILPEFQLSFNAQMLNSQMVLPIVRQALVEFSIFLKSGEQLLIYTCISLTSLVMSSGFRVQMGFVLFNSSSSVYFSLIFLVFFFFSPSFLSLSSSNKIN